MQAPIVCGDWFLSDLWFETVAEYASGAFDDVMSPAVLDYLVSRNEVVSKEADRLYSADSLTLLARMTARRQRVAGESFALRLRVYSVRLMLDEIGYILALGRRHGLPWAMPETLGPS